MTKTHRDTAITNLYPPCAEVMQRFRISLFSRGLPFVVWETHRTQDRQQYLWSKGRDDTGRVKDARLVVTNATGYPPKGAHVAGMAADWVIITTHDYWATENRVDRPEHPWDTGVDRKTGEVVRPDVLDAWKLFGLCAASCGLQWGGHWKKRGKEKDPIGWDPYHVEMRNWRAQAQAIGGVWHV